MPAPQSLAPISEMITRVRLTAAGLQPFDPASQVLATFGRPAQVYDLGRYTVLVWHQNLLRHL
jgi:hypothetical protein